MRRFAQRVPRCMECACPVPAGVGVCGRCLAGARPPLIRRCVAAVDYGYPWDALIARFKFRGEPGWATVLAEPMLERALAHDLLPANVLLMPIPVTSSRLAERGYNQAWELTKVLQRRTGRAALADALVRVIHAPDQHQLSQAQRLNNLRGAFAAHPQHMSRLAGARVMLVDDVRTTGATLNSAALALQQAGVADIAALVLARTPSD
jgi:ComF family protein